jgi:deoxyribodipyrimidine photo-lyase
VVSLAELRDLALARADRPEAAQKLVSELAWRDYYQRVYVVLGERVWEDQEPYKTGFAPDDYAAELPPELPRSRTGLACMDDFARELAETGYLHNHARMWVAAYVVHTLRVRWQAGARWFLRHLLDGDPASNNLSWQWVASTFSHKPYFFNRANLERHTGGRYCATCPTARSCPFAGSYPELARRLFPNLPEGSLER